MSPRRAPHIPPVVVVCAAAAAQRMIARRHRSTGPLSRSAAGALGLASAAFMAGAVREFLRARTTVNPVAPERATSLVTSGPHQISRNPMYVGMVGWLVSHAIARGSWAAALPVAGFVAVMNRTQIAAEEAALAQLFGREYLDYCARVPRWLGRLGRPAPTWFAAQPGQHDKSRTPRVGGDRVGL